MKLNMQSMDLHKIARIGMHHQPQEGEGNRGSGSSDHMVTGPAGGEQRRGGGLGRTAAERFCARRREKKARGGSCAHQEFEELDGGDSGGRSRRRREEKAGGQSWNRGAIRHLPGVPASGSRSGRKRRARRSFQLARQGTGAVVAAAIRSEERRVGKEC